MRCIYCYGSARDFEDTLYLTKYRCPVCRKIFTVNKAQPPAPKKADYMCFNHQGKANAFVEALSDFMVGTNEGYAQPLKFALTDSDVKGRTRQLERIRKQGTTCFFVYPHSARPSMVNDYFPTWEGTTAQFVVNEYHAQVLREYGYKKPLHGIGWHLCPLREFQKKEHVRNVLFCPIHPRNAPQDKKANAETFMRLYRLVKRDEIKLTVRHIDVLEDSGLCAEKGVTYINARTNQDFSHIDSADVVVGHQTVAWIAVARGVPTVMMGEDMPTHFRHGVDWVDTPSWNKVSHLFRYPLDILQETDTMALLNRAAQSDDEIRDWRARMIGNAFDPLKFSEIVKGYL